MPLIPDQKTILDVNPIVIRYNVTIYKLQNNYVSRKKPEIFHRAKAVARVSGTIKMIMVRGS